MNTELKDFSQEEINRNFSKVIRETRLLYGLTQNELAEMAGVRESTISDIVRGTRTVINFEHLGKIASALEIDDIRKIVDSLRRGEEPHDISEITIDFIIEI